MRLRLGLRFALGFAGFHFLEFGDGAGAQGLTFTDLLEHEAIADLLALVTLPADRLDVGGVPEALGRQVCRLDVVELLGGDREARLGAGTA